MRGSRRTKWIAGAVWAVLLLPAAPAVAERDEALIKCVEGGGIYYDDGRCEGGTNADPAPAAEPGPADEGGEAEADDAEKAEAAAKKDCRRQGGRWRDGECRLSKDPVERCQAIGGMFMVDGKCFKPGR
jgi:hypothetical protein